MSIFSFFTQLVLIAIVLKRSASLPRTIRIGGLFDTEDEEQELAFRIAVDWINNDPNLLPNSRLAAKIEKLQPGDSYDATKKVCSLLGTGVAAIFGPQTAVTSMHVGSICDELEVPHIETRWDYIRPKDDLSINLYPNPAVLSQAYVILLKELGWQNFTLLYEENEGILRLQNFLKGAEANEWNVHIYRFGEDHPFRDVFWQVKRDYTKRREEALKTPNQVESTLKIVLDVSRNNLQTALKHALQIGLITEQQQYLVTNLDIATIDLEDFKYSKCNILGFRLSDETNSEYKILREEIMARQRRGQLFSLRTDTVLTYDAVRMFAKALQELDNGKEVRGFPAIDCYSGSAKGTDGTSLINYMKSGAMNGVTGVVTFDGQGLRSLFKLDLIHLAENGMTQFGSLLTTHGINITKNVTEESLLERRTFIITTIVTHPYVMLKNSSKDLKGNERYEGFCIDIVEELSKILHFSYVIRPVADDAYGAEDKKIKGRWTGMVGEVMRGEADMAVADLSINSKREKAVDFTMPFMNTGISILFKKPTTKVKSLFSFLSPFSSEVWFYLMAAFFGVSLLTFVVGRLTPYEWINPHPCRQDDIVVENIFNVRNSMWLATGSLMQQGSDLIPTAFCTRTAASFWNFFTLIMVSSYTANLAAFLTVEKAVFPIESANDLAKQSYPPKIQFGCLDSGSTRSFFEDSNIPTYKKMWSMMSKDASSVLVKSNERGKEKVRQGNYAYLMESATIEYITERECSLTQIGGLLDNKGYGIAVKKGNRELADWLSSGILQLQEEGAIHTLKERWWTQKGGGKCGDSAKQSSSKVRELSLRNVGGVFVVLIFGLGAATVVALIEYWWKTRQYVSYAEKPFWRMLVEELKFALSCENTTKPVPKKKSPPPPTASSTEGSSKYSLPSTS